MATQNRLHRKLLFGILVVCFLLIGFVSCADHHSHEHHGHDHGHAHSDTPPSFKYSKEANPDVSTENGNDNKQSDSTTSDLNIWAKALMATAIISIAPIFILVFIPLENTKENSGFLKILLSFASGGLLGDAFLHLIPHAVSPHDHSDNSHGHSHSHSHGHSHGEGEGHSHDLSVGIWVLSGIIAFLCVEKFVRYMKGGETHGHSHSTGSVVKNKKEEVPKEDTKKKTNGNKNVKKADNNRDNVEDIKVAGYLNLAADFAHNFTDGLAIGASFLSGHTLGIITTFTIFLHEIPHEIGDFAILVQSGCSKKKAMKLQFSTAIGAMLGTVCSLLAKGIGDAATAWILPFTAGGFIYIATVSVIPELLKESNLMQSFKEILALLTGVFMMVLIAVYE